jgi:hypothetical protein
MLNNLPANINDEANRMLQETASANARLVYKKGKYFIGDDEVEIGHQYIAFPREWTRGFVKWDNGHPIAERLGRASEYNPTREEMGDLEKKGEDDDPWTMQNILPLVDVKTEEFVLFCSNTWGGLKAIKKLVNAYYREIKTGRDLGNPIIAVDTYDRQTDFGLTPTPKFNIVSWENADAPLPQTQDAMNDAIPF